VTGCFADNRLSRQDDRRALLQQSMQQAQEQNDEAEQQFNPDMQPQQTYETRFSNP
jgi:hypothetical protein